VGSFTGPVFAGAVYDIMDSYRPAFLIVGLTALAAVPLVLAAGRPQRGVAKEAGGLEL